jgi:hypothetical protein
MEREIVTDSTNDAHSIHHDTSPDDIEDAETIAPSIDDVPVDVDVDARDLPNLANVYGRGAQDAYYRRNAPNSHTSKAIQTFITRLNLSIDQQRQMQSHIEDINKFIQADPLLQADVPNMLREWGMPVHLAAKMSHRDIIALLSLVNVLTE